jgi:hypothetical protein
MVAPQPGLKPFKDWSAAARRDGSMGAARPTPYPPENNAR